MIRARRPAGFTLLEVLVALVIIAVAVAALARAGAQVVNHQFESEQRTMALWVADNVLAELRLDPPGQGGRSQGSASMGGRNWHYDVLIQPAPGDEMLRADVAVYSDSRRTRLVFSHTGFLPL